jgi:hypothetical protein
VIESFESSFTMGPSPTEKGNDDGAERFKLPSLHPMRELKYPEHAVIPLKRSMLQLFVLTHFPSRKVG